MFSMKENHFGDEAKAERSIIKFFDPWERKLAFDADHNDRMSPSLPGENLERVDMDNH